MRLSLKLAALLSGAFLPLAAYADTYSVTNVNLNSPPPALGESVGTTATNQAISNNVGLVLDFNPTGSGFLSNTLSFTISIPTAYGLETINVSGTNSSTYAPGFDSSLFSANSSTITGPSVYSIAFSSINSAGSGATETIYAQLYNNPTFVAPTPEPGSFVLLGTGLLGLAGAARRRIVRA